MRALRQVWSDAVSQGIDLKHPTIANWMVEAHGVTKNAGLTKDEMLDLLHQSPGSRMQRATTALGNAINVMELLHELHLFAFPPCRLRGGSHEYTKVYPSGHRDNNEYEMLCQQCGHSF